MPTLTVPDISCGHCVQSVTNTILGLDPGAEVSVDLAAKRVTYTASVGAATIRQALADAGYPVSDVQDS